MVEIGTVQLVKIVSALKYAMVNILLSRVGRNAFLEERERERELVEWRLWLGRETFIGIHECSPLVLAALNNYASLLFDYGPGSVLNDDSPRKV